MAASEWFLTDVGGLPSWELSEVSSPAVASGPPASVDATATGGTTLSLSWVPGVGGSADLFDVELETPTGSGNWVAATGATNPVPGGTLVFAADGLSVFTSYTPRVRSKKTGFADSAWTVGAAVMTDNSASGGAVIGATDGTAPTLTGSISITSLTSNGYVATCPAASDAVGVTGYQWRLGGVGVYTDIPSGGRVATFTGRTPATTDNLEMRARDAAGNFSNPLVAPVSLPGVAPTVTTQPLSQNVVAGASVTFVVGFSGTPAPTVQWYKNGLAIPGTNSTTLSFISSIGDTGSIFVCEANNGVGGVVSSNGAVLTVTTLATAPAISTQPASQSVTEGQAVTFSVVATGTNPISYQWRRNGTAIVGATNASYTFSTVLADSGASFDVVVSNSVSSVTSTAVLLGVTGVGAESPFSIAHTIYFPEVSDARAVLRLSRSRGDTFADVFVIKSSVTNLPIDVTGCTFLLTVDPDPAPTTAANNILQLTGNVLSATNGQVAFAPNSVQADLVGSFYFDIQMTDSAGSKRTLKYGEYSLRQDITK